MSPLKPLAEAQQTWSLDEFVAQANELLPNYLPEDSGNTRVRDEINARLVRHYASLGMLDEPLKEGREARYEYRHLLQLLVVRRLLAEGFGTSAIGELPRAKPNSDLEAMLEGGVQLILTPANPALAYLDNIKNRVQNPSPAAPSPAPRIAPKQEQSSHWTRYTILPGLELHVRDDFSVPKSPKEQQNLLQFINQKLIQIQQRRNK